MNTREKTRNLQASEGDVAARVVYESKPRVLLVDDDQTLLNALRRRLQFNFDIELATSARQALTMMKSQEPFAVIVADMTMPGMDGATLLGEVKRFFPGTVRVMLTGHTEPNVVNRAVNDSEVFRFLSKPCSAEVLDRVLEEASAEHIRWMQVVNWLQVGSVCSAPDDKALRKSRAFLNSRRFDVTTGLANRRTFEGDVLSAMAEQRASSTPAVLIHLDVDGFRLINESCGFGAGDELLRHVAEILLETVGPETRIARLSGDEFGILLRSDSADAGLDMYHRIFDSLASRFFCWDGELVPVSMCGGVVSLTPDIQGVTAWLLMAETACGVAKQLGKGRVHVTRPDDPEVARRRNENEWVYKTQQAVDRNRFTLMFQRIVPLQGRHRGREHIELLLRMVAESGVLESPAHFMPIAERYHLGGAVDRWVILNAFQWLAGDANRIRQISLCSINLSAGSLFDQDFVSFLGATRDTYRIPAETICLEITETAAMADLGAAAHVMCELRKLGFRFALDDFGSGLCSFAYLKNLPVDYLKIDGSFVRQLDTDETSYAIVESINRIAQVTGKKTVAEFVENDAIRQRLTRIGVDFGQGYAIHRPTPIEML
jgi:diguanylate cyclase (GGDEF)-like protein